MSKSKTPEHLAAVDLGSNSFHMVVARVAAGEIHMLDAIKERVALAEGLDRDRVLVPEVFDRALDCLQRFGQRLDAMPSSAVRVVGTNTLRHARNRVPFMHAAREALGGHPIEIISGREEARLVYLGVAHSLADDEGSRLVIDIGGGSTEFIIGQRFEPLKMDSLEMGCVSFSRRFFGDGAITKKAWDKAVLAARLELGTIVTTYESLGWQEVVGSSGTVGAVAQILEAEQWSKEGISRAGLRRLVEALLQAGHTDRLELEGLKPARRTVIAGGTAILSAVFDGFSIKRMKRATGALREGVLYDLLGRLGHEDVRYRTIARLLDWHGVDREQSRRVQDTALELLRQAEDQWELDREDARRWLGWAAELHETGMTVSTSGHHLHGAYLVRHSDLPGFSSNDQEVIAALVGKHRRALDWTDLDEMRPRRRRRVMNLCLILRLAVLLHRTRSPEPLPPIEFAATGESLTLGLPDGWLDEHPLTQADLELEARWLDKAGYALEFH